MVVLWKLHNYCWLVLAVCGHLILEPTSTMTTEMLQQPTPTLETCADNLELGPAGGIRQIPPMVEVFVLQLSEFLLLLASFPILLLCNKPREVLLAVLVVTLMAALWQKLCITCFHSILLNITFKITIPVVSIPVATTSPGQETFLQ